MGPRLCAREASAPFGLGWKGRGDGVVSSREALSRGGFDAIIVEPAGVDGLMDSRVFIIPVLLGQAAPRLMAFFEPRICAWTEEVLLWSHHMVNDMERMDEMLSTS